LKAGVCHAAAAPARPRGRLEPSAKDMPKQHDEFVERFELSHPVFTALKPFLNGGAAGMMSCCAVHPLDTLKACRPGRH